MAATCNIKPRPVNPITDAGPSPILVIDGGDSYDQACATLQVLNCAEGANPNCAATMRNAESAKLEFFDANCLKDSISKAAIRSCGNGKIKCL